MSAWGGQLDFERWTGETLTIRGMTFGRGGKPLGVLDAAAQLAAYGEGEARLYGNTIVTFAGGVVRIVIISDDGDWWDWKRPGPWI